MNKNERVKFDAETQKWFENNPGSQTTVMCCEKCGLWYKPDLGHGCEKASTRTVSGSLIVYPMNDGVEVFTFQDFFGDRFKIEFKSIQALDKFIDSCKHLRASMEEKMR